MAKNRQSRIRANTKYNNANTIQVAFRFNINTDYDIIKWLELKDNKQGYIKQLIRADMTATGYNPPMNIIPVEQQEPSIEVLRPEYVLADDDS